MPVYFIDTNNGDTVAIDDEGFEFADDEAARTAVLAALPDMARDHLPGRDNRTFKVSASRADGTLVYTATMKVDGFTARRPNHGLGRPNLPFGGLRQRRRRLGVC